MAPTILLVLATLARMVTAPVTLIVLLIACLSATMVLYATWVGLVPGQITSAAMLQQARASAANTRPEA